MGRHLGLTPDNPGKSAILETPRYTVIKWANEMPSLKVKAGAHPDLELFAAVTALVATVRVGRSTRRPRSMGIFGHHSFFFGRHEG